MRDYEAKIKGSQLSPASLSQALSASNRAAEAGWQNAVNRANESIANYRAAFDQSTRDYAGTFAEQKAKMEAAQDLAESQAASTRDWLIERAKGVEDYFANRFDPELAKIQSDTRKSFEESDKYLRGFRSFYDKALQGQLSLADAMRVHEPTRQEYERLSQRFFDESNQQLAAQRQQSLADYGTLAALGSQAMRTSFGPMTGVQQALQQQAAMSQASQAYQNALARMNAIRDQQLAYQAQMRERGVAQGLAQSQWGYQAGLQAANQAQQSDLARQQLYSQGQTQLANLASLGQQMRNQTAQTSADLSREAYNIMQQAAQSRAGLGQSLTGMQGNLASMRLSGAGTLAGLTNNLGQLQLQQGLDLSQRNLTQSLAPSLLRQQNARELADISLQRELGTLGMSRADRLKAEEIALARELARQQMQTAQSARKSSLFGGLFGGLGTLAGGVLGGPIEQQLEVLSAQA